MKYTYAYKDSDGKRHEAAIEAPSRDAAFAALREQGIRPIKVVAADGSKANGAPVGVRRRVMAVSIIVAVVAAGGSVVNYGRRLTEYLGIDPSKRADFAQETR